MRKIRFVEYILKVNEGKKTKPINLTGYKRIPVQKRSDLESLHFILNGSTFLIQHAHHSTAVRIIYNTGFTISTLALIIALFIFLYFKYVLYMILTLLYFYTSSKYCILPSPFSFFHTSGRYCIRLSPSYIS